MLQKVLMGVAIECYVKRRLHIPLIRHNCKNKVIMDGGSDHNDLANIVDQQLRSVRKAGRTKTYLIPASTAFLAGGNHQAIGGQSQPSTPHLAMTYNEAQIASGMRQASSFTNLGNRKNKQFSVTYSSCSCNLTHLINEVINLRVFDPALNFNLWKKGE